MERPGMRGHQQGQTLIYVAIAMVLLLAIVSLAIDVGNVYTERRRMQNAADAGALAGAQSLCMGTPEAGARQAAIDYAQSNGAPNIAADIDMSKYWVTVNVSKTADLFLAPVIGVADPDVPAVAQAACGDTPATCGLWPVAFNKAKWDALYNNQLGCGRTFYVWTGENRDPSVTGNNPVPTDEPPLGHICDECQCDINGDGIEEVLTDASRAWLDFSAVAEDLYPDDCISKGCGAEELKCLIRDGTGARITLPACIGGDSGVKAGTKNAVEERAGTNAKVPLFDSVGCAAPSGSCSNTDSYHVVEFGCIKVDQHPWDQNLVLDWKDPTGHSNGSKCLKDKFIRVSIDCTPGACETGCGNASNPPKPGSVNSVSLIK